MKAVESLGPTAVPLLARMLRTGDDRQTDWASYLVARGGGSRALSALRAMSDDGQLPGPRRVRAMALLAELGAPVPAMLRPLEATPPAIDAIARSVERIRDRADAAWVADQLVTLSDPSGLVAAGRRLAATCGAALAPVLEELAARDDLSLTGRRQLIDLRNKLGRTPELPARPGKVYAATLREGQLIVVVAPGSGARRRRALVIELGADGALVRAVYDATGSPAQAPRAIRARYASEGIQLRRSSVSAVAAPVAVAARLARGSGDRLPRAFYLGRDLLGLTDEHMTPLPPAGAGRLLERGTSFVEDDDPEAARPLLQAYISVEPQDAEARTWLAGALLSLGEREAAAPHLAAAARLEPEDPVRHWNLAAVQRQVGHGGAAYLALGDFLRTSRGRSGEKKRRAARRFRRAYEQMIVQEHPDARPRDLARLEDVFACACDHLEEGRLVDAVRGFEQVLRVVPSHHQSWGNLGAAYAQLDRPDDARRCFEHALLLRPDYELAQANLRSLDPSKRS